VKINMLLSMVGPEFTPDMEAGFALYAEWVVLNRREERLLVDAVGNAGNVATVFGALDGLGREPQVIGAWYEDGTPVPGYAFSLAAWLAVAPDVLEVGAEGEAVPSRPTGWLEGHRWAGWAPRQVPA
jgi:hypothetical protein